MRKRVVVLGSTGSIGMAALDVIRRFPGEFRVVGLSAHRDGAKLAAQAREFKPEAVCLTDEKAAVTHGPALARTATVMLEGADGIEALAAWPSADLVLNAVVGLAGLPASVAALSHGKTIALANKESLVAAGRLLMNLAEEHGGSVIPVDSEHSAIWQCLAAAAGAKPTRLVLTASGGPFFGRRPEELAQVTPEQALRHPTWQMGPKVTIDSATLMNKGFEVLEAAALFDVPLDCIDVLIHRQSAVHSMIQLADGALIAQIGAPDMRLPIAYALSHPRRLAGDWPRLDLSELGAFTFAKPKPGEFPCLDLAYMAGKRGGGLPAALTGADEVAVDAFLSRRLAFTDIAPLLIKVAARCERLPGDTIDDIIAAGETGRRVARELLRDYTPLGMEASR
ncbi:MAG: 1-deoxy-D-xylulose-5-phosphate reductoisomerase [Chloroflexota bacterium]